MSVILNEDVDGEKSTAISSDIEINKHLRLYQDIYHQITGKTEKTTQSTNENLLIDIEQIKQLHHKIYQLCDIHNVVAKSEVINVFHKKERKEEFTSFERFNLYNSNCPTPTLMVVLKYNFSILPNGGKNPQQYTITIKLNSKIAIQQQIEDDAPSFFRGRIVSYINSPAGEISVEYADYVIARSFVEAFNEWVDGCKKSPKDNSFIVFLKNWSHTLPQIMSFIFIAITTFFSLKMVEVVSAPNEIARSLIITFFSFIVITSIARFLGGLIESSIDNHSNISYLKLNVGDSNLIDNYEKKEKYKPLKIIVTSILTIILGVLSSKIADIL
ncbi:hypothetical protein WCT96_13235 [Pectobacterium carotovorum]|uniref:hypothetical protein n=1 Tax=Pectobacterium carotovorum TaxID=554 RepID=UPI0030187BAB